MTAIGKGEANPIADNTTKAGRAENRRIEVELLQ
jgi:OOP family OmpA-OmpF porin